MDIYQNVCKWSNAKVEQIERQPKPLISSTHESEEILVTVVNLHQLEVVFLYNFVS